MKKKIFGGIAVLAIAVVAAWNVNVNSRTNGMSDVMLANVEALAQESTGSCKWKVIQCPFPSNAGYGVCITNGDGVSCDCGSSTHNPLPC